MSVKASDIEPTDDLDAIEERIYELRTGNRRVLIRPGYALVRTADGRVFGVGWDPGPVGEGTNAQEWTE